MKLLSKTSIYYLLFALPLFAICSVFIYYFISSEIKDSLDESLWKEKTEIEQKIAQGDSVEALADDEVQIWLNRSGKPDGYIYSDTNAFEPIEDEILPYRVLHFAVTIPDKTSYQVSIKRSYVESDDVISSILIPIIVLFVVLFVGILLINFFISKRVWKPFHQSIEKLKNFKLGTDQSIHFSKETISEFNDLNTSLNAMIFKASEDYRKQKEFTENASHEIQTPLAIIQNKIELLIQSKNLGADEMEIITSIYESANRLSRLNKTLLLLTKIENHQFKDSENIQFRSLIEKVLNNFEDVLSEKNITIKKEFGPSPTKEMNATLADILISNLIQNAIRHNRKDGNIHILTNEHSIIISNTSDSQIDSTDELFNRFKKNQASAESTGLGLAIVREICDNYSIELTYTCHQFTHTIQLDC
jgi:signal transduction histidine kinase